MSSTTAEEPSLLDKLDQVAPLAKFDAFPKVPSTYKTRSESRGFMTLFVAFMAFMLVLNDVGEFIWGWPDYEFSVDNSKSNYLNINLDMIVAMPCGFLSVDLRDAMGDRLYLSGGLRRDGTLFDVGQATALKEHAAELSATEAVSQSRKSRGMFAWLFRRKNDLNSKLTYKYKADGSACRIAGTLVVKRVTANLHITTLGHGYSSYEHVDHKQMNLSHIITELSFGPFFPEIVQPLDNSFESTDQNFIAYQYFLHVVPTTYIAPRAKPLRTNQYSVTHYTREVQHDRGTPGIFFKFELDPLEITLHQRTTTFLQLLIRCVGVLGGVFVCMGYAIKITTRAVEVVSGADNQQGIVAAESSGVKVGLRAKWGGGELRARPKGGKLVPQGNGWTMEGGESPYSSYNGTPVTGAFTPGLQSPYLSTTAPGSPLPPPGTPGSAVGLGYPSSTFGPPTPGGRTASLGPPPPRTPGSRLFRARLVLEPSRGVRRLRLIRPLCPVWGFMMQMAMVWGRAWYAGGWVCYVPYFSWAWA
ncbi:endoplasmic reticulum vesicle transporter-domain-containing protein [Gymnopilus junonius]|uniref:Endoplasmic reticulum vesicle transporter-domain-containing protein n=1 Tax=Gymnopilus junonius TaxID=109634 RepID=A0A9P5TKG6_GYMJU|nr:endoplasmic reticulum vesicle transporter-domain-containing protein [Gymnopilus junonius]